MRYFVDFFLFKKSVFFVKTLLLSLCTLSKVLLLIFCVIDNTISSLFNHVTAESTYLERYFSHIVSFLRSSQILQTYQDTYVIEFSRLHKNLHNSFGFHGHNLPEICITFSNYTV